MAVQQLQQQTDLQLVQQFKALYGCTPFAVAKAPGRVNLIGEHIDYEGYGVMPMALLQACSVAIAWEPAGAAAADTADKIPCVTTETTTTTLNHTHQQQQCQVLRMANVQSQLYPAGQLQLADACQSESSSPCWWKYIHAAYRGVVMHAAKQQQQVPQRSNILLLVHGTIPPGAGLSSSSALVVSAAMALLALWRIKATPAEVAELTCSCERFVGTQGGGMDQAVACLAQPGLALYVEFNPVRAQPVPLPAGAAFVVANCLAPSHKAETASSRFNLRVLECRLAAMLLDKQLASMAADSISSSSHNTSSISTSLHWRQTKTLQEVEDGLLCFASNACKAAEQLQGLVREAPPLPVVQAVEQVLPQGYYHMQQVADLLGAPLSELTALLPPALQTVAATPGLQLQLQQRAKHVFAESQRVLQFKEVCLNGELSETEKLSALGLLMDGSHSSCAGLYQCSCEELDTLVAVAKKAGALGARLTGAGWGGCMVALVPAAHVDHFMQQLRQHFYEPAVAAGRLETVDHTQQHMFCTAPAGGLNYCCCSTMTNTMLSEAPALSNCKEANGALQRHVYNEPYVISSLCT